MPRSFDRDEQRLRRHLTAADEIGIQQMADSLMLLALEKIIAWSLETGKNPYVVVEEGGDDVREFADRAIDSIVFYLSTKNVPEGFDAKRVENDDRIEKLVIEVMNEAVKTTAALIMRSQRSGKPEEIEATLNRIRMALTMEGTSYENELVVSPSDPQQSDVVDPVTGEVKNQLNLQNQRRLQDDIPMSWTEMNEVNDGKPLAVEVPPGLQEEIPGWGHPPICDCPDCVDDIDPDDPRLPGFYRLNKAARTRFCPPEKDRQWNCPLCGGSGTRADAPADTEGTMITTPGRDLPEEEPFNQRTFEP